MAVLHDINTPKPKEVKSMTQQGKKDENKEPSAVDRIIEARVKGEEAKAAIQGLGGTGGGESVQTSIVTTAMQQQKVIMDQLNQQVAEANKELLAARKEREEAQTQLYNERISILQGEKQKLDETAKAAGPKAPKSEMEAYRDIRAELQKEIDELKKNAPPPATGAGTGVSDATQITLKKLELDQAKVLEGMQADRADKQQAFDLKLREFDEDSKRRWAEYADSRAFRQQGIEGVTDLVGAIGAGITKEMPPGKGKAGAVEASISQFPCQICGTLIPVEPGETHVFCSNEECKAEYDITKKGE